ncbi:MAG: phosphatase PAP2 family protein [Sporolactobacillus sp.]
MNQLDSRQRMLYIGLWFFLSGTLAYLCLRLSIQWPAVQDLDQAFLISLSPLRQTWFIDWMRRATQLASSRVLFPLISLAVLFLLLKKRVVAAVLLPLLFLMERSLNHMLKQLVARPRPDLYHYVHETGYSFPSGHAMNAATMYGLLIIVLLPHCHRKWTRALLVALCVAAILLVGFTRPFLQVHYLTDILGGYAVGLALNGLVLIALACLQRRMHR